MPAPNGRLARIVDLVRLHPGLSSAEIGRRCGFNHIGSCFFSYLQKKGRLFRAGLPRASRWFASAEEAAAHEAQVVADTKREREARKESTRVRSMLRKQARRPTKDAREVVMLPNVKVTIIPTPPRAFKTTTYST